MPYLAQLSAAIVTVLISFLSKNSDKYLEKLFAKIGNLISAKSGKSAAIIVSTNPHIYVEFSRDDGDIIKKLSSDEGIVTFKEFLEAGNKIYIKAYGDGYKAEDMTLEIDNEYVTYAVSMKLDKEEETPKETIKA